MKFFYIFIATFTLLSTSQALAGLSSFLPKPRPNIEPKIPSPYQRCTQPLRSQSHDYLFACAEDEFWHGFSDGRLGQRRKAHKVLSDILNVTRQTPSLESLGRIYALRGYLRLAMALENARLEYIIFGGMERDFNQAKELHPDNKVYDTFLDTIVIAKSAMFGRWHKATEAALPAFDILEEEPTNILALSGTTIGFPLSTGVPQKTIDYLDAWVCPDDIAAFCYHNTLRSPFARPGINFHFAEAYARMGDVDSTLYYLEQARISPGYSTWQYQDLVEEPLADIDSYMSYWGSYGPDDSAFRSVYANQNFGCVMCHGR